jgi:5,10-methylenetetrahydromethanopterin reductase
MVGIYASSMQAEQLERNGIDPTELKPIIDAMPQEISPGASS